MAREREPDTRVAHLAERLDALEKRLDAIADRMAAAMDNIVGVAPAPTGTAGRSRSLPHGSRDT